MGILEALAYGLVQGVTEFLPVSSSTHLALLSRLLAAAGLRPLDEAGVLLFHLPTLAAVLWVLRREIRDLFGSNRALLGPLILATAATAVLGFLLNRHFGPYRDSLGFLGTTLMATGLILLTAERFKPLPRELPWTWKSGLAVGVGQSLAGIPGLSRLGMSMSAGILTGKPLAQAAVFSFLCAIPVTLGKTALECRKAMEREPGFLEERLLHGAYPLGALVAFIAGVATFRWLLGWLKRRTLAPFGIYCALLGGLALTWSLTAVTIPHSQPAPAGGTEGHEPKARTPGMDPGGGPGPAPHEPGLLRPQGSR